MIFSEDTILLSLLERSENEDEMKDAVLSYCSRGALDNHRPEEVQPEKVDGGEMDMVSLFVA